MLLFNGVSYGFLGLCFRMLFLSLIDVFIYFGRSLYLFCIFPCGMLRLFAVNIMLVSILLPCCAFVGSGVFVSACSIIFVEFSQFTFF